ncbi:hypothetical protein MNEG_16606 [Monoraphidium neglectum]|uniref:Alpha-1,2-Mannosidase n=1 Tax=Monoraphidium neglectum TaxID=145388 RepID=A0A0D2K5B8_9CHLO|nr:hypothetical protein MNEG_16606 [Monoraphidium neglectum]KIY91358.1 hypothetical protein MNEG_16606 [Monoraphidium neglectum]|eukprot:XP_013890378.1 hypothetical protein MNEG_16606 [Monoraphidium neglectum]
MLAAATGDPAYTGVAAAVVGALRSCRAECGFTRILDVVTGRRADLMESYFLSETVKYLYLTFVEGGHLLADWFLLSTEGHVMPVLAGPDDDHSAQGGGREAGGGGNVSGSSGGNSSNSSSSGVDVGSYVPDELEEEEERQARAVEAAALPAPAGAGPGACAAAALEASELLSSQRRLQTALPLLALRGHAADARRLQRRRCAACVAVTAAVAARPAQLAAERVARLNFGGAIGPGLAANKGVSVLGQVACRAEVLGGVGGKAPPRARCRDVRALQAGDSLMATGPDVVVLQCLNHTRSNHDSNVL